MRNTTTIPLAPHLDYYGMGDGVTAFSTTRIGGYSTSSYASFNINRYCGDLEENVSKNRALLCELLGIGGDRLLMPHQVHLTKVATVDEAFLASDETSRRTVLEGVDALMTNVAGVCIGVSTADCIPILLYDSAHRAVCAVHAGWRGTVARIAEKAVAAMTATYGSRPEELTAQIGPGISLDSFEVGDEVYDVFAEAGFDMKRISKRYPKASGDGNCLTQHASLSTTKWHIDLKECNRQQLATAGVPLQSIAVSPVCTYLQSDDYFSARRLGIHSGRIFTGIIMFET